MHFQSVHLFNRRFTIHCCILFAYNTQQHSIGGGVISVVSNQLIVASLALSLTNPVLTPLSKGAGTALGINGGAVAVMVECVHSSYGKDIESCSYESISHDIDVSVELNF